MDISQKIQKLYEQTGISPEVHDFGEKIEKSLKERFDKIDKMAELNQLKVIHAMQEARVNAECFNYASGYGYNDFGRDTLEKVYANVFHTEDAAGKTTDYLWNPCTCFNAFCKFKTW